MKKPDAEQTVNIHPALNEKVEAVAVDAMRDLWDRTVDNATLDPASRLVTPSMVRDAIEARLADYLGAGVLLPKVRVEMNAERTGFVTTITPGTVPGVVRQVS